MEQDVYKLFLSCKSFIAAMTNKEDIPKYIDGMQCIRENVNYIEKRDMSKEERLVLDKIKVYLEFATKDVLTKLERNKEYKWVE